MSLTFSPSLLQNLQKFKEDFFSGEKEVAEIRKCPLPEDPELYIQTKWQWAVVIFWHIPLLLLTPLVLAVAYTARFLKLYWLSTRCFLYVCYNTSHHNLDWSDKLLVPTYNTFKWADSDVYNRPSIKKEEVPIPFLNPNLKKIQFNFTRTGGLCHGGSLWFIYLFLKSFSNTPPIPLWKRAFAVAKQFENGQPKQAALLQCYYGSADYFLPLKNQDSLSDQKLAYLKVNNDKHVCVYMQEGNEILLWDPDIGLLIFKTKREWDKFLKENYKTPILTFLALREENVNQTTRQKLFKFFFR